MQGLLAQLVRRGVTGRGGRVEVSLLETALDMQVEPLTVFLNGGGEPVRTASHHANPHIGAPYGIYRTADGFLALAMTPLDELARLLGADALARAAADRDGWFRDRDALKRLLQAHLAERTTGHWLALLEPAGIWCADVLTWPRLVEHPGFQALDMIQSLDMGSGPVLRTTRCPIRIDQRILHNRRPAPALGAHTDEILRELGLATPGQAT